MAAPDGQVDTPGPEKPASFLLGLFDWFNEFLKFQKFWRTRKAVLAGDRLELLSKKEMSSRDLMGPLSFNFYESVLAGLPTTFVLWFTTKISFGPRQPGNAGDPIPALLALFEIRHPSFAVFSRTEILGLFQALNWIKDEIRPFLAPFSLLLLAYVVADGALRPSDRSPEARRQARDAWLYLDGAYGLYPQTFFVLFAAWATMYLASDWPRRFGFGLLTIAAACGVWQLSISLYRVPRELFIIREYAPEVRLFKPTGANHAPWGQYWRAILLRSTIFTMLMSVVLEAVELSIAAVIAKGSMVLYQLLPLDKLRPFFPWLGR